MARMSREFSLVLLGATALTAGYLLWPDDDLQAKADKQAEAQVGGNANNGTHRSGHMFLFIHTGGFYGGSAAGRSPAMASVSRGGFGGFGHAAGGG